MVPVDQQERSDRGDRLADCVRVPQIHRTGAVQNRRQVQPAINEINAHLKRRVFRSDSVGLPHVPDAELQLRGRQQHGPVQRNGVEPRFERDRGTFSCGAGKRCYCQIFR